LVARISRDALDDCRKYKLCFDCYAEGNDEPAKKLQTRRKRKVPCCRAHWYAYKLKINRANARKYARRSAAKRKAGLCVSPGCHHKLIPQELLPAWWKREKTCGMHGRFKARVNRAALVRFVIEHCLMPALGEGMVAQNIIYYAREGYILLGLSKPNLYLTRGFSASDLLERYEQFRRAKVLSF
jgi:hypothetical protein